jgi:hypothetical protein
MSASTSGTSSKDAPFRDVVTSHLREDTRILASVLAMRRIYGHLLYDVYLCVYSGLMGHPRLHDDLLSCLVVFKKERIRVMFKLWTAQIEGDRQAYIEKAVGELKAQGKGPFQLILDAKTWTYLPLTLHDRAAMKMAGVPLPRTPSIKD